MVDSPVPDLADVLAARQRIAPYLQPTPLYRYPALDAMAALLNDLLARTAQPRLVQHERVPLHLHVDAPGASWGGWLAASGAMALALLIAEHGTEVLGGCQAHGCAHVLLRIGPGPARRFCDNTCASRTRVAAYRASRVVSTGNNASNAGTNRQCLE